MIVHCLKHIQANVNQVQDADKLWPWILNCFTSDEKLKESMISGAIFIPWLATAKCDVSSLAKQAMNNSC